MNNLTQTKTLKRLIIENAIKLTKSEFGFLFELSEEHVVVKRTWSDGVEKQCLITRERLDGTVHHDALWAKCIQTKTHVYNNHVEKKLLLDGHIALSNFLAVPVLDSGKVVAILAVANKKGLYRSTDAEKAGYYAEFAWNLIIRHRMEDKLRKTEALYRVLVQHPNVGFLLIGNKGVIFANNAVEITTGIPLHELTSFSIRDLTRLVHPDDRQNPIQHIESLLRSEEGVPNSFDIRIRRATGDERWVTVTASRVQLEGEVAVAVTLTDSQERHEAAEMQARLVERLDETLKATIQTLCRAVEARDPYTAGHQQRVSKLSSAIAKELGLDEDRIQAVRIAGLVHDIGKIAVPSEILAKPGKLHSHEMGLVQMHSRIGHDILEPVRFPWPIHRYVLQHHERMDGSGYPDGLTGDEIELESRILAVADVLEAMASHRPYRPGLGLEKALNMLEKERGRSLDSEVVDVCLYLFRHKNYQLD